MVNWRCVKNCGACCYLEPTERPELEEYLSPEEVKYYISLIGADGWCINYDPLNRECRIYTDRPKFCRVEPDIFKKMYNIELEELNAFAIDCCQQHIGDIYGEHSLEMLLFNNAVGIRSGFQR